MPLSTTTLPGGTRTLTRYGAFIPHRAGWSCSAYDRLRAEIEDSAVYRGAALWPASPAGSVGGSLERRCSRAVSARAPRTAGFAASCRRHAFSIAVGTLRAGAGD